MEEQVASSVVGKVLDLLFGAAKQRIDYAWNCTENVDKLRKEVEKLKGMKGRVQQQIDAANRKGDNLKEGVEKWVENVDEKISKAEEFLEQEANAKKTCFNLRLCVNLSTLYHYSKEATNKALSLLQHQEDGTDFESCVSIPAFAPRDIDLYLRKNHDQITTQNLTLGKIIEAIEDESKQIIGIYGLGGVGKTTLANEVAATMKNQFADIVIVTVSQHVDTEKIKKKVEAAAKRIMKGEKILIILDDVWEELQLPKVGIPSIGYKNCKILLTSRSIDVCVAMNTQSNIYVKSLPEEEAWILFKRVAGERVETDEKLKPMAMKVAKECGGLPLIIHVMGNALKDKSRDFWGVVLHQLNKDAPSNIAPALKKAYKHLKLSYDELESEAKTCFLLCSMFPEDALIPLELLTFYVMGAEKFNDLGSIEEARNRVQIAVNTLKSSFLLLDGYDKHTTKMHDVVRDVALLIASEGENKENKLLVMAGKGLTQWDPRNATKSYTGISLMENQICKLPDHEFHFPHLDTFLIRGNYQLTTIPDKFIDGIKEAKVLDMEFNCISSLPQSLKLLSKLRMLNLGRNRCPHEISILGELNGLEILILNDTEIKEIPQEIGQLVNLRRLEVIGCRRLSHITPGVISKLRWLEELRIKFYSMQEGIYGRLVEVMTLSKLTFLDLLVPCFDVIPQGFDFGKLEGFVIQIGSMDYDIWDPISKSLIIGMCHLEIPMLMWTKKLIRVSHAILFDSTQNLNDIMPTLWHEGFNKLESIELFGCDNVSCLVDTRDWEQLQIFHSSKDLGEGKRKEKFFTKLEYLDLRSLYKLKVLWNCPDQDISLNSLVTLKISSCHKLVRLFSVRVAQGLGNLRDLQIMNCKGLEEVIWARDEETYRGEIGMLVDDAKIVFRCLAKIFFYDLPILKSFYSGHSTIEYPSLVIVKTTRCYNMKRWGHGIHDTPKLEVVGDEPLDGHHAINEPLDGHHAINDAMAKYNEKCLKAARGNF